MPYHGIKVPLRADLPLSTPHDLTPTSTLPAPCTLSNHLGLPRPSRRKASGLKRLHSCGAASQSAVCSRLPAGELVVLASLASLASLQNSLRARTLHSAAGPCPGTRGTPRSLRCDTGPVPSLTTHPFLSPSKIIRSLKTWRVYLAQCLA